MVSTVRKNRLGKIAILLGMAALAAIPMQLSADFGPAHKIECLLRTRNSQQFMLPDNGVTLDQFRKEIGNRSHGCANVVVVRGADVSSAHVVRGGSGKYEISFDDRAVYVDTDIDPMTSSLTSVPDPNS